MARTLAFATALIFATTLQASPAHADEGDEALAKACPGLRQWKQAHPHVGNGPDAAGAGAKASQPALQASLRERVEADQKAREAAFDGSGAFDKKSVEAMAAVDATNLGWLKQLVAKQGFPTVAQVGRSGVADAFLLVQHADADPEFQASMLAVLESRVAGGGVRKSEVAMLTDRVLVAQGKPQRYGSQYVQAKNGGIAPKPIEDPAHVDERRAAMELPPMALYECALRASIASP
jgi:hypothetical protein